KVVHTADMRKPASDVAGIEEVNAKADDSKVVHTADTSNWQKQKVTSDNGLPSIYVNAGEKISDRLIAINKAGFWSFNANVRTSDNPWGDSIKGFTMCYSLDGHWSVTVGTLETSGNYVSIVNDNGKIRFNKGADDSKVAHLSGANNFDTVPTVNNNPLLLASSLPSDLARTSQQTNFTAGLQSGGVDVATAADLKSIEASAWKLLVNSDATTAFYRLVDGTLCISGYARVPGGGINPILTIVSQLPTELQNKVWTIQKEMTVGSLSSGTAYLSFGKDSSLFVSCFNQGNQVPSSIVVFNNSYKQS
ncbi:hypothetical protein MOV09_11480, partial [Lacticaseibacillus paracasei]|nr:hypothetical protein [Lacticaseibacillus paracasei]